MHRHMINLLLLVKTVIDEYSQVIGLGPQSVLQSQLPNFQNIMYRKSQSDYVSQPNPFVSSKIDENRLLAAGRLSSDLVNLIEAEISNKQLEVNEVQKEFKIKLKGIGNEPAKKGDNETSKKLVQEGQILSSDKSSENDKRLNHSQSERKYFKSNMTPEDIEKIKRIKVMQKKYELQLENKTRIYEQNLKKFHQEEAELLQKQRKQKNEERLKEVARKIAEIRQRQVQRSKKIEEQKRIVNELKHEKKLYEKLDEHYRLAELQEQRKKEEIKLALKKQKNVNFDEIKQHERKYEEIMRAQKEEREKKLGQLPRGNSKRYYQSKMLKDLMEEEARAKAEHIDKKQEAYERYTKEKQYADYVRNNYLPNVPLKDEDDKDKDKAPISVSAAEKYKMGNQYMKQVHQNLTSLKGSSVSKVVAEKKEEPFKYKDYLKDIRAQRKLSSHKQSRYLQQIDNLMKKETMTQQQKFYKAKLLTQQLEDGKGRNSQKLINSINAKIHLLKSIEPQLQS